MINIIILPLLLSSILFASIYDTSAKSMAADKKSACQKALNNAREEALSQAGTLVISTFSKSTKINNKKYNSIKNKELKSISVGVAKLISKKEIIKLTDDYQFYCTIDAKFSIDENEMKKAINKYLSSNKEKNHSIYIKAKGYSEEGQSRYKAIKAATIDAKRNLLEEIKGSEFFSVLETRNGKLEADKLISNSRASIRFVKVLSTKYNTKTKSAIVIVGMTKENLNKNIQIWKNKKR